MFTSRQPALANILGGDVFPFGPAAVLSCRVAGRPAHFMPASLVASQFTTLEPLGPDEAGIALDLDLPVDELVARIYTAVTTAAAPPVHHNGKEASP